MSKGGKHGKREDGRRRGKGEESGKAERQERIFQREEGGKRQGENMKRASREKEKGKGKGRGKKGTNKKEIEPVATKERSAAIN